VSNACWRSADAPVFREIDWKQDENSLFTRDVVSELSIIQSPLGIVEMIRNKLVGEEWRERRFVRYYVVIFEEVLS